MGPSEEGISDPWIKWKRGPRRQRRGLGPMVNRPANVERKTPFSVEGGKNSEVWSPVRQSVHIDGLRGRREKPAQRYGGPLIQALPVPGRYEQEGPQLSPTEISLYATSKRRESLGEQKQKPVFLDRDGRGPFASVTGLRALNKSAVNYKSRPEEVREGSAGPWVETVTPR
jgi:hypothetical protein